MPRVIKTLSLLLVVISLLALTFGTGAFTTISADRFSQIDTASDDEALMGIEMADAEVRPNEEFEAVYVTNRFGEQMDVTNVEVVDDGGLNDVTVEHTPAGISPGATEAIELSVVFGGASEGTIELAITGEANSASVELTREVTVEQADRRGVCRVGEDPRIGDREFIAEDEVFDCTVVIDDRQGQYEIDLDNTTIQGGLEFDGQNLRSVEMDDVDVYDAATIDVDSNLGKIEIDEATFGDGLDIDVGQNINDEVEIEDVDGDVSIEAGENINDEVEIENVDGDVRIDAGQNVNGEVEIEDVTGDVTIDADHQINGEVEVESTDGDVSIEAGQNINDEVEIENVDGGTVVVSDGSLEDGIAIEEVGSVSVDIGANVNGEVEIENVDGNLIMTVGGDVNGEVEIEEVTGDVTVSVGGTVNDDVEIEDVGGETTRNY